MSSLSAIGIGIRRSRNTVPLDVTYVLLASHKKPEALSRYSQWFEPQQSENHCYTLSQSQLQTAISTALDSEKSLLSALAEHTNTNTYSTSDIIVYHLFDEHHKVESVEEGYLKLHLLSHRLFKPHRLNLDNNFATLHNLAWTNHGPMLQEDVPTQRIKYLSTETPLIVSHVDKFPYMVNYHIPSGVRIASGAQVRLGAYLGEGTTVMPSGFINFNAGTEGNAMVEGRVSAGVVIGKNSDIGGGASIMGTLSGGNSHVISIGEHCLLGANGGAGISLGQGCTIAAGLYVYAGMKISLLNEKNQPVNLSGVVVPDGKNVVKALELSGRNNLLFIHDSQSGKVICKPNSRHIQLNDQLHKN